MRGDGVGDATPVARAKSRRHSLSGRFLASGAQQSFNNKKRAARAAVRDFLRRDRHVTFRVVSHEHPLTELKHAMQKYSLPLMFGLVTALVWFNAAPKSFKWFWGTDAHHGCDGYMGKGLPVLTPLGELIGHPITPAFLVNDVFMAFFFGLAAKEVVEALLPGGSLNPISKAGNPLMATFGGVLGPVAVFLVIVTLQDAAGAYDGSPYCAAAAGGGDDHHCGAHHASTNATHDDHYDDHRRALTLEAHGDDAYATATNATSALGDACAALPIADVLFGWGVPTATDISLAWVVALRVFGPGHGAIDFLLLLAVVDDAIGLVIIAVVYTSGTEPVYLLLNVLAMAMAWALNRASTRWQLGLPWWAYIGSAGFVSWVGLIKAHVHPALAFVFIVPFLPTGPHVHADADLNDPHHAMSFGPKNTAEVAAMAAAAAEPPPARALALPLPAPAPGDTDVETTILSPRGGGSKPRPSLVKRPSIVAGIGGAVPVATPRTTSEVVPLILQHATNMPSDEVHDRLRRHTEAHIEKVHEEEHNAPLHQFEETLKFPVDCGLFFFAAANAAVNLSAGGGPMTVAVLASLVFGKSFGIAGCALAATKLGFPLPQGVGVVELFMLSLIASIGLTVALFVSGLAFQTYPVLASEAKLGALLSAGIAGVAIVLSDVLRIREKTATVPIAPMLPPSPDKPSPPKPHRPSLKDGPTSTFMDQQDLAQMLEDSLMQQLALRRRLRRYQKRGVLIDADIHADSRSSPAAAAAESSLGEIP